MLNIRMSQRPIEVKVTVVTVGRDQRDHTAGPNREEEEEQEEISTLECLEHLRGLPVGDSE